VTFYTIGGGGHTWPGGSQSTGTLLGPISQKLDASQVIWETLADQSGAAINTVYRKYNPLDGQHLMTLYPERSVRGYSLEGVGFQLYANQIDASSRRLYRCSWASGYFDSKDPACEGQTVSYALGFAHDIPVGNELPIYRFYLPATGDHLITINPSEGYGNGYLFEEILGYGLP
jgi:hypothetical protein